MDGNLRLNESRAICCYLISKYAKGDMKKLYPEDDVLIKAKIDQKLYFDMGTFYQVAFEDFVSAYIYLFLLDNAPNYLVGCVIQKRWNQYYLMQFLGLNYLIL